MKWKVHEEQQAMRATPTARQASKHHGAMIDHAANATAADHGHVVSS